MFNIFSKVFNSLFFIAAIGILLLILFRNPNKVENYNKPYGSQNDIEAFTDKWGYDYKTIAKDWKPKKTSKLQLWCVTNPKKGECIKY